MALAAVLAACSRPGGPDDVPDRFGPSASSTPDTAPSTTAGDPTQRLVVEATGVTLFPDPLDEAQSLGGFGVVVRNPHRRLMATGVTVVTTLRDPAGEVALEDTQRLNAVMPGKAMAVGRTIIEPVEGPLAVEVDVTVAAWLEPASRSGSLDVVAAATEPEPGSGAVTTFTVRSSWPTDETGVDVTALYRDAEGNILAAESNVLEQVPAGAEVEGTIRLLAPIPGLESTQVVAGRGFEAQTQG